MKQNELDQIATNEAGIPMPQHSPFVVSTSPDPRVTDSRVMRIIYTMFRKDFAESHGSAS
jgi:hypothetical protein